MKHFLLSFCLFLSIAGLAQSKDKLSAKKSAKGDQPFYRTKSSDIFYIGVENRFILYKDPTKKYTVSVKNGVVVEKENSADSTIYVVNVKNNEPTFVNVSVDNKIYAYKFRNKKIPSPEIKILLGSEFSKATDIDVEKFANAKSLVLELTDFDFDVALKIIGMQLTIVRNGQKTEHLLTDQAIEQYSKGCIPGDIYIFKDVVVEYSNTGTQRTLSGKTFFVK